MFQKYDLSIVREDLDGLISGIPVIVLNRLSSLSMYSWEATLGKDNY